MASIIAFFRNRGSIKVDPQSFTLPDLSIITEGGDTILAEDGTALALEA